MTHLELTLYLYAPAITAAAVITNAAWARAAEGNLAGISALAIFGAAAMIVFLIASGSTALLLYCGAV